MPLRRFLACSLLMLLLTAGGVRAQAPAAANGRAGAAPKNAVLMISDGAGPASFTMARDFRRSQTGRAHLALDALDVGSVQTFSADSRVTDSAAGATAFSTGHKTDNGAIAVDTAARPLATLLEAAEQRGMATGLVATSRLTHATPASFAAHTPDRWKENEIARQMLGQGVDVLLGGGRRHFLPESAGGERTDGRDLVREAKDAGYTVVTGMEDFSEAESLPLLGLFSESHMSYEIDRDPAAQPSLKAMAEKAMQLLSESEQGRANGFFLMIEGSRIDHAAHDNDAAALVHDALAYDDAVAAVRDFARADGETLLVSTSDHETGGLSLGRSIDGDNIYAWKPSALAKVDASHGAMLEQIAEGGADPAVVLRRDAGIDSLSAGEQERLGEAVDAESFSRLEAALSTIIGRRAVVGWTTGGHTAVDVGLYAFGPGRARFIGHHDNTFIGATLAALMGFDLDALTAEMRAEREMAPAATGGE